MNKNPKILVGTLYSGENELDDCKRSLAEQSYGEWHHHIIKNLPNKIAHDTLYQKFMGAADEFDLFLKLDADMVFTHQEALSGLVQLFRLSKQLHHAELAVKDWFSDSLILGIHAFTNKCRWLSSSESLFVDTDPLAPTPKMVFWESPAPIVNHCPNPGLFQSFHFGVHRALKIIQKASFDINWPQFYAQSSLLKKVWHHFKSKKDVRLGMVILGADLVFHNEYDHDIYDYTKPALVAIFNQYKDFTSDQILHSVSKAWQQSGPQQRNMKKMILRNPLSFIKYKIRCALSR